MIIFNKYKKGEDIMKEDLIEEKALNPKEDKKEEMMKKESNQETENKRQEEENKDVIKKEEKTVSKVEENINKQEKMENKQNRENEEKNKEEKANNTKNKNNNMDKKVKKKARKIIISIIIVGIMAFAFSTVFALTNMNNEKIISGVTIKGIEVSGLTKEEAISKLKTVYAEKMENNIMLQYEDFNSELNPTLMEVHYDIEKAVNEAYSLGRNGNIFVNNYHIVGALIAKRDFNVVMTLNEETTKKTINDIGANLPGILIESGYSIEEDELIITRGKEGIVVDTETLLSKVKEMLNDIQETDNVIEIPVIAKAPQEIDVDKIHSEIYKEPKDAYYTKEPFTIYPEVEGIDFDVEKAKEIIAAEVKDEYIIDLIITKPKITLNDIGTEAFPDRLSTFSTKYNASDKDRTTNLVIACKKLNGKVIMPGEILSYNETLGPRTYAAGYRNGKIYENGQVVDGLGGGICQISSTLYNAALMSDMEIVERRNHQFVTSYVNAGRDATVVYGLTDFKFKNTRTYPVRLVASASGGVATVSVFGIKEPDREYTYSFKTETVSTIPYTTKYVEDSNLAAGKEVITQSGANGLVCKTYMTKMLNGKIVSTKLLSTDTYSAMQRIIKRGTSKVTSNPSPSTTKPVTDTETNQKPTEQKPEETTPTQHPEETAPEQNQNVIGEEKKPESGEQSEIQNKVTE